MSNPKYTVKPHCYRYDCWITESSGVIVIVIGVKAFVIVATHFSNKQIKESDSSKGLITLYITCKSQNNDRTICICIPTTFTNV